ncbi:hypothetical protein KIPB_007077 [Kipferlia bialata]|uniref:Putative nitroreductase TM1586 domain-containing protein n=1 Tax=Kipferlia bialata TaxID=797122 RepID=A0A9K3CZT1_9EUKA|nr:hypothetical protein KIPB_007077 [Kipferlia bialata]|eukprot:g7077.t1
MSTALNFDAVLPIITRDVGMLTGAMVIRHSTRKYSTSPVDHEALTALQAYAEELSTVCADVRLCMGDATPDSKLFKLEKIRRASCKNASHFCVGLVRTDSVGSDAWVGLLGEMYILKAASLGVHTCWIGGTLRKAEVLKSIAPEGEWTVSFITPLGNPETPTQGFPVRKRKELSKMVSTARPLSDWERRAAEAMQSAPSALNKQPRTMSVENGSITLREEGKGKESPSGGMTKRLDTCIALTHVLAQLAKDGKIRTVETVSSLPLVVRISQ